MGILRTDVVSHSQLSNGNASVLFDGTTDSITIPSHSAFAFGTGDWTVEGWFYFTDLVGDGNGQQTLVGDTYGGTAGWYLYKQTNHRLGVYYSSLLVDGNTLIEADRWYHLAFVRHSGRTRIYINGELDAEGADTTNATVTQYYIADTADQTSGEFFGNISNLRITRTAVYKTNFTVPKFKLKEIPGTILLCCQSSSSTTEATVSVPGTLSANGDPTATAFGPGLKEDITDTGVVFDGVTTFDSQAYFVPPSGKTTERNRGRAVFGGGATPSVSDIIDFVHIPSGGNAIDFGDKLAADNSNYGLSNSIRGLWAGGRQPSASNVIEFITIATTSNTTDFGDLTEARIHGASVSNSTRGIFMSGGTPTATNVMDFVTIATTGNAQDFGDTLTAGFTNGGGRSSSTRGIRAGNGTPAAENVIEFITIATTGNGQNFGDLTQASRALGAGNVSNGTRAVLMGGYTVPAFTNVMSFITIASAGDAQDFGDISSVRGGGGTASTITRGILAGGRTPTDVNTIDAITIATTGNSTDFGDLTFARAFQPSGCSDSHGGLS